MKRIILPALLAVSIGSVGCGSGLKGTPTTTGTQDDGEIATLVMVGGGETTTEAAETEMNMNYRIAEVVAEKVRNELDAQLESGDLSSLVDQDGALLSEKDIRFGLGNRGLSVFIEDEEVPFAGGTMILNGEVGLKLKIHGFRKLELIASGQLTSELDGVERSGAIKDIPYTLALYGDNTMEMEGSFLIGIKRWKVNEMSASLKSSIVESDVTAVGSIADRIVSGSVDMVDVAVTMSMEDLLNQPKNVKISCEGYIATSMNENELAECEIASSCLACD